MATRQDYAPLQDNGAALTITSGQQNSDAIDVIGMTLVGIRLPSTFTGTSVSILESDSLTGTYRDVYNISGNPLSFPVAANRTVIFNPADLASLRFLKLRSSSTEGADRVINLILRALA